MDYITEKILNNIDFLQQKKSPNIYSTLAQYYRMFFEYHLRLMFACLWDRKAHEISVEKHREIIQVMEKPVLGKMLTYTMQMNKVGEPVFNLSKDYEEMLRDFINIRNTKFAHRILIKEKDYMAICKELDNYRRRLIGFEKKFLGADCEFLLRQDPLESAQVIIFKTNHVPEYRDVEKSIAKEYAQKELYFHCNAGYFKVSPFLLSIESDDKINYNFYYFEHYESETGKFDYHSIFGEKGKSDKNDSEYDRSETFPNFFRDYKQVGNYNIRWTNGIVSNKFENNYDYFLNDIAPFDKYVTQVSNFLTNDKSVCLTIRGGGGVGKTALVQYICTKFFNKITEKPEFNYVIFCSAKDKDFRLNIMTEHGQIYLVDAEKIIDSYKKILFTVCKTLGIIIDYDAEKNISKIEEEILEKQDVLFIFDNFETLPDVEREKVVNLINRMQSDRHKVLITTRVKTINGLSGSVYDVEHMDEAQVISFMKERFKRIPENSVVLKKFQDFLAQKGTKKKIYGATMGLPLLTIPLASLMPLKDFEEKLLSKKFADDAEDFLLGKPYSHFATVNSKLLFLLITFFAKYERKNIPASELKIFYELHCRRKNDDSDINFEKDLGELKKWNVIKIEDASVLLSNFTSYKALEQQLKKILAEYPDKIFDEQLFKLAITKGLHKGVLEYFDSSDAITDDALTNIFVLENVCKFTKKERFQMLDKLIEKYLATGDKEKFVDLYSRGRVYFNDDREFLSRFEKNVIRFKNLNEELKNIPIKEYETFKGRAIGVIETFDIGKKFLNFMDNNSEQSK